MSVSISLFDLTNLSINYPEPGVVNFLALHSLLHAIIKHLGIQDVRTEGEPDLFKPPSNPIAVGSPHQQPDTPASVGKKVGPYQELEQKLRDVEQQVQDLSRLPTGLELLERSKQDGKSVNDMWNMLQLKKNMEANTEGVDKVMSLMEDMMQELNDMRNFKDGIEDRMTGIDKTTDLVMNDVGLINEILNKTPEQLQKFVSWKILQDTLVDPNVDAPTVPDHVQQSPTAQILVGTVQAPDVEAQAPVGTIQAPDVEAQAPVGTIQAPDVEAQAPVGTIQAPDATVKTSSKVTMPQAAGSNVQAPPTTEQPSPATLKDPGEVRPTQVPKPHVQLTKAASFTVGDDGAHLYPDAVSALQRIRFATDSHPILVQRVSALEKALAGL
ncbi:uncharacterized protein C16orf96-like, partial [Heptranchias perlo]|uniref:uncharacterized protein C16orf96-like n=1 Tax=Heptranchias perlo TaxID=212740 RepID=UPI0035597D51